MSRVITGSDGRKYATDEPLLHPPKREWVGLTDEDMDCLFPHGSSVWVQETVKIIEAKLKEKNT